MREKYESLGLVDLKEIAKHRGIKGVSTMKKSQVIEAMLALDEQEKASKVAEPMQRAARAEKAQELAEPVKSPQRELKSNIPSELDSGVEVRGILEVLTD